MKLRFLVVCLVLLSGCATTSPLDRLITDYERYGEILRPDLDAGAWPDASFETVAARNEATVGFYQRLQSLETRRLADDERITHAVLDYLLRTSTEIAPFEPERISFTNDSGFFSYPAQTGLSTRLRTVEEGDRWVRRLENLPDYFDQQIAWLQRGIDTGVVQAAYVIPGVIDQVRTIAETPAEEGTFYLPVRSLPSTMAQEERERIAAATLSAIETRVLPAYHNLLTFLEQEYLPNARTEPGLHAVPGGRDMYRALVRQHTTLDLTPEQVHQTGLEEVARIRAEMEAVIAETGFEGSFAEFLNYLRTDAKFYAQSEEELLMRAAWLAKRADDQMPRFFRNLPRLPYGVRPVPASLAPNYTTGRYWAGNLQAGNAGAYMVNTYALDQRPLYELPALTVHEGVPGHHHQIAIAQEQDNVPAFRRRNYITAFGEGWGLYTEFLAIEMGLYDTPYDHFGRLTFEMWRACRLVVDTGMHYFGWSVEQAEACLLENSALAPHNVRTEVARYVSWPGQALAYKTGELLIRQLRADAEATLGDKFDLRAFHDHLLSEGAMPLSALEARMRTWIAEQGL